MWGWVGVDVGVRVDEGQGGQCRCAEVQKRKTV